MSTPEPPAPMPSATTRCAWCDRQLPLGAWTYCSADCKQEAWLHSIVPPASAPAATAETDHLAGGPGYGWPLVAMEGEHLVVNSRHPLYAQLRELVMRPAAPTGEGAGYEARLAKALRDYAAELANVNWKGGALGASVIDDAADALTAQATELAALHDVQRAMHAYRRAWEGSKAEMAALRALLQRVMTWNDAGFHDNGLPPLIVQDLRAALAPRQTTEPPHA